MDLDSYSKSKEKKLAEGTGLLLSLLRDSVECSPNNETATNEASDHVEASLEVVEASSIKESSNSTCEAQDCGLVTSAESSCEASSSFIGYYEFQFHKESAPAKVASAVNEFTVSDNYLKGCKWSPDGLHILTCSNDRMLRIFDLPDPECPTTSHLQCVNAFNAGELVYDYSWYPFMTKDSSYCSLFMHTSCNRPIQLRDFTKPKELIASYLPVNHLDEKVAAHSVSFSLDGRKVYAGFKKCIRIFDFFRPGPQIETRSTTGDKHLGNGQSGIISTITMCPTLAGCYACGSYDRSIAIYADELPDPQFVLQGQIGGVTHLMYSPDGHCLFSGGRKDNDIICWDMRNLGAVLCIFERQVLTNQRIYFDIDKHGKYLMTGNSNGCIKIWDIKNPSNSCSFSAHDDCTNGVSFNPFSNLIASSSGQRKNERPPLFDDEEDEDFVLYNENSVKIWKCE